MSSALHSPQPQQSSKQQWWSRPSASRSTTVPPYRSSESPGAATPITPTSRMAQLFDDRSLRGSKQSKKFNSLVSVIGFKSKKTHPTIDIPSGPVSPPLPFQNPPKMAAPISRDPLIRPPRASRPITVSSGSSYQYDPKSPGEPSIYTYPSSEEAYEPMTPSDQLSRHRTSYQPSLFTFAEQQDHSAGALRLGDEMGSRYSPLDARRISVMSDPSVIDPQLTRELAIRSSQVSSYYPASSEKKGFPGRLSSGLLAHRDSLERRKSSGESRRSKEIDLTLDSDVNIGHRRSTELRPRDYRHSDLGVPAVPKVSASMLISGQRPSLRKSPSETVAAAKSSGSRSGSRTGSPVSANGHSVEEHFGKDRVANLRNSDSPANDSSPASARLSPVVRPKAASVSAGSVSGSSTGGRPSPSIVTSFSSANAPSRNASITSGAESAVGSAVRRQQSISRIRAVPPSRNPPPMSNLPPTPHGRPPSPLTFRSPKNVSTTSLLNSANSASDDPSILAFDLPPSTPSSEASSVSLCFAPTGQISMYNNIDSSPGSSIPRGHREMRGMNSGRLYRPEFASQRSATHPMHTAKSSLSSNHTLMNALGVRGETPVQRSVRKSMSQSSISGDRNARGERQRVDSETSITSANLMLEENGASMFNSMRSLRKQRSMHNTRAPGGSLALPPLPQQLRHASSFNTASMSEASGSGHSSHTKGDSFSSPFGSQRRVAAAHSSTPTSTANSLVSTPTTPQTHKKRSIFSSHGRDRDRDRRDSNATHEREKQEAACGVYTPDAHHIDRKKSHSIGLGLFSGHFSPSMSPSQIPDVPGSMHDPRRASLPSSDALSMYSPGPPVPEKGIPNNAIDHLDQHILPPKELLSQMEALADTEAPSSPPQFSDRAFEGEADDDYWDRSSIATTDKRSLRSRVNSVGGMSVTFGADENSRGPASPSSTRTRHFANASGSIHGRLQSERPSTTSRLQSRDFSGASGFSRVPTSSAVRPATADSLFSMRDISPDGSSADTYCAPTALPPPPRRKGAAISTPTTDHFEVEEPEIKPLSAPPPRNPPSRLHRLPSFENQGSQRLPSHETISTYNPNRGSIFRKPSFLNIDDEFVEQANSGSKGAMSTVPEDSFLILEHGKDSLELGRMFDDL